MSVELFDVSVELFHVSSALYVSVELFSSIDDAAICVRSVSVELFSRALLLQGSMEWSAGGVCERC